MTIIQVAQGMTRDLSGTPKAEALAAFAERDAEFCAKFPGAAKYHRPSWQEREVADTQTAPWGFCWHRVDEAGLLQWHSAQYDSGD